MEISVYRDDIQACTEYTLVIIVDMGVLVDKSLYNKELEPKCIKMKIVVDNRVKALYNGIHDRE